MINAVYEIKSEPYVVQMQSELSNIPHLHKEIEIIYVEKGSVIAHVDRKRLHLTDGDIFISFPNQIHYYKESELGAYYVIIISPDIFFGIKNLFKDYSPETNSFSLTNKQTVENVIESYENKDAKYSAPVIVGYLNLLMGDILSELKLTPRINADNNSALKNIMTYCYEHYSEEITLDSVAEGLHLSKYYISKLLNRKIGLSFNDYINNLRIYEACHLLTATDKKIADISEDVGFGTIRSFNRSFLRIMNMTPVQYRDSYKAQSSDFK